MLTDSVVVLPTLHNSVSGLWLLPPGNHPIVDRYGLSVTLPVLSYTVTRIIDKSALCQIGPRQIGPQNKIS